MPQGEKITHEGIVVNAPGNGTADVEIVTGSACAVCHARSACSLGSTEVRTITVKSDAKLNPGDKVTVEMEQSQGFRALAIGYLIPFLVLIAVFAALTIAGAGELGAALLSFASLAVYYFVVWLLRGRIDKKFEFKIKV
ncbi:MAG: SoxR reducing system RseC family protein [Bacteroidales bacterium]